MAFFKSKKRLFSVYFYNPITYIGVALSFFIFSLELFFYLIDTFISPKTLYFGLITYLILPPFLFLGLALIPLGALWKKRKVRKGKASIEPSHIHIDLSKKTHRNAVLVFVCGTSILLIATMIGLYKSYHYTDSVQFCGQMCHTVMHPEFTVYQDSPHSRVKCVDCHIGSGAEWYVRSKFSGSYQVYSTIFKKYPKPIPSPVKNLRPARETCEQCHWPEYFYSAKEKIFHHYLSDEKNTYWPIRMLMKVGGGKPGGIGQTGIHWHMNVNNDIEYMARDKNRQEIAWVKLTNKQTGEVQEYVSEGNPLSPEETAKLQARRFDCIDCHNRPTHRFPSPVTAVNEALVTGRLDKDLPYIKREAVKVLSQEYHATDEALQAIQQTLSEYYRKEYPDLFGRDSKKVEEAVLAVQNIFKKTQFPEMKVRWDTHPDNIGHMEHASCFRCHGSDLVTREGKRIEKDCNSCHAILSQGPDSEGQPIEKEKEFIHPVDLGMNPKEMDCVACHSDLKSLYE